MEYVYIHILFEYYVGKLSEMEKWNGGCLLNPLTILKPLTTNKY